VTFGEQNEAAGEIRQLGAAFSQIMKGGIECLKRLLDSGLRRNDGVEFSGLMISVRYKNFGLWSYYCTNR
jgi:hypothetical protein